MRVDGGVREGVQGERKGRVHDGTDLALLAAPELKEAVQLFASEENVFKQCSLRPGQSYDGRPLQRE
ncbi:hypothetical protein GQ600_6994 [Phytophthora cactorum]|nr:hypothetical protein GQ600_6994 [Phytophthora cactorum]